MSKPYDRTFKLLAERYGRELLLWLGQIAPGDRVTALEREVGVPALFVDQLYEVERESHRFLVHLESQTRYKPDVPERMLWYAVRLYEKYRLPVQSVLLVLMPEDAPALIPDRHHIVAGGLRLEVHFSVVKLWEMDYREVFERGWTGLLAFVPLMKLETEEAPDVLRRCLEQAAQVEDEQLRRDLFSHLVVLGGLRFSREQLLELLGREGMFIAPEKLRDSSIVQMWIEEGLQQGLQQGLQEGQRVALQNALLAHIRKRFSDVPATVEARIREIQDVDRLNQLLLDVDDIPDVVQLERRLSGD